jgi:hypothetical protein
MPDFHNFMMRHGEHGIQAIIEQIERYEGVRSRNNQTLEDRWDALMQKPAAAPSSLAA